MEIFDPIFETRLMSDEEQLADMVRELDWKEAQLQFADVTSRMCAAQTTDPQLFQESEAANKRLFALFEQGWAAGNKLLFKPKFLAIASVSRGGVMDCESSRRGLLPTVAISQLRRRGTPSRSKARC